MDTGQLPPGFREYDYLQLTGHNARIDTGVSGNDSTLVFDFTHMRMSNSSYRAMFGNYVDENTKCWRVIQSINTYPTYCIVSAGNRKAGSSMSIMVVNSATETSVGHKVRYHVTYGRVDIYADDGRESTVTSTEDGTTAVSSLTIAIGANNPTGAGGTDAQRIYGHFKIWSQGALIREYVPAVRLRDSKAGFYDLVNHTFNPSIGTAEFIAGNDA